MAKEGEADDTVKTPDWLADLMVEWAGPIDYNNALILDPCSGEGAMYVGTLRSPITEYDIRGDRRDFLCEFPAEKYDVALVNPPYSKVGAYRFCERLVDLWMKPDGIVVCVCPMYQLERGERHLHRVGLLPQDTFAPESPVQQVALLDVRVRPPENGCRFEFVFRP
jgi:hypothetical protein